jgi:CDP-glycerol glycerophosphotransferase (TagB/SpsB family)
MQFGAVEPAGFDLDSVPSAPIAVYFADPPEKLYQLTQWLPIFEDNRSMRTIVVVRHIETYRQLLKSTKLQVLLVPRYEVLMALYDRADFHAVIYVNNGWTNFQSLAFQQAVHIHVNHGESDKICMVSNQAKAYDRVFIAGEAAAQRHAAALAWFDQQTLVRVGRPQLDRVKAERASRPTITYAPTWEGEDDVNNYTSVDLYGPRIVAAAIAQGARVVYKPHPRILLSDDPGVKHGHQQILSLLGGEHDYLPDADILPILAQTDVLIADVSSVTLDHLYLRPDAALMLCDRRSDREALLADAPIAASAHILDANSLDTVEAAIANLVADQTQQQGRTELRNLYFDGLQPGQSTDRFWTELQRAIHEHDSALQGLSRTRVIT